ncbi:MAG: ABC transporter ATP-binding protein [Chloroflexi bacterium]|nr:ABC transporter ATP-binding protein [Chloroflexota bacterium]
MRLTKFAGKYWVWLLVAFVLVMASTGFSIIIPRMIGDALDEALGSQEQTFLFISAAVVVGTSALRGLTEYGNRYLDETISQKTAYDIRSAIFKRLQRQSFAYYDQAQTGQLMSRATVDVEAVRMFFSQGLLALSQMVVMMIAISIILLMMDWKLALLTLAFVPAIAWRGITVGNLLRPIWLKIQQLMASMGTTLEESLTGIRVVKAFSRHKEEERKFTTAAKLLYNEHLRVARVQAFNVPLLAFLIAVPTVVILWYGGRQVIAGTMTLGDVTKFILYAGMMAMPVRRMGMIVNLLSRTVSAGGRIFEILDSDSAVKDKSDATELEKVKGQVVFEGVSFGYGSVGTILENISFRAQPGQMVALLGGSGSGKSTLVNLISRFYDVTGGRITIDGIDIRDVTLASLRKNVGIVQQDVFLFSATVRDNIAFGAPNASMEQIIASAKTAHLHNFIEGLPDGYDTLVGERGVTLSGGEKQRLAIARTLLVNPSILILDDSTSNVDAETEVLIRQALNRLVEGRTTFVITHRVPLIKRADLILLLKDGEIVEQGKHDDLISRRGLYWQLYESQLIAISRS